MTELNVQSLRTSFASIDDMDGFSSAFYDHLFTIYPEVKSMFTSTDMKEQRRKLIAALKLIVSTIDRPDRLRPAIERLGQRHFDMSVVAEHFPKVQAALLLALEGFCVGWSDEISQQWTAAYTTVAAIMIEVIEGNAEDAPA